jgi:type VI secretion system secreted protein VgrG
MTRKNMGLVAGVGLVTLLYGPFGASAQVSPSLGSASTYSILAGSQVTNTGATTVSGDVGISPGVGPPPHFTGFGTVVLGGTVHDADTAAANAQADKNTAYGALDQGCTFTYPGAFGELAGQTLVPGVYCATSFHLTGGTLTLSGAAGDTWIFKSASDLIVSGGAPARVVSPSCNIWWRVVSSASLDAGSSLAGNILADTSITFAAGASLSGRALARTAEVTLSSNTISACTVPVPTLPEWAFIMMAVLLAAAGAVALRRRTLA